MKKSPATLVKEKFESKEKLVAAVKTFADDSALWLPRTSAAKGLEHVSNAKLLRLHAIFSEVKEKFGTRDKLVSALLEVENRTKDTGWKSRVDSWPLPRLYDAYKSAAKRNKAKTPA